MKTNYFIILSLLLLIVLSFYSVESFIDSNATSIVQLAKDLPISRIEMVCVREPKDDAWINLIDITILDENENKVNYWTNPNSANFANGNLGWLNQYSPIEGLYDDNPDSIGHSSTAPDKLTILLNPALNIGSIQITNRRDCCFERIQKYDLNFYNNDLLLGNKPLTNLGGMGKSIMYVIMKPGPAGGQGPEGKIGPQGPIGPEGKIGLRGPEGAAGPQGPIGLSGPEGAAGPQGKIGPQGPIGLQGPQGLQGTQGIEGQMGPIGPEGPVGLSGKIGVVGPIGTEINGNMWIKP